MADSWEQHDTDEEVVFKPKLNPAAASFSFNPSAGSFTPSGIDGNGSDAVGEAQTMKAAAAPPPAPVVASPETAAPKPAPVAAPTAPASTPPVEKSNGAPNKENSTSKETAFDSKTDEKLAKETAKKLTVLPTAAEEKETEAEQTARKAAIEAALEELNKKDPRDHLNIVFIGHVDAGKSTTAGQILFLTGGVDDRTIEKYEREAKEKNRESWYMAYIMDTNEEERAKGKTVEVGRAYFETPKKRYTILDAPGHKSFVPNMITGAAQADVGVLVISARKGEFETGFERGGQTREHAQLAKTLGVTKLVVVINKMDDPSAVESDGTWSQSRYQEIEKKLTPFLKGCGYNPKKDLVFLPISGLMGHNIKEPIEKSVCSWYDGETFFSVLDNIEPANRDPFAPFRMPVMDRYKDMGTVVMGKSEAGLVRKGDSLMMMPNRVPVKVSTLWRDDEEVAAAKPGENLRLRLSGIEEDEIQSGFVLCDRWKLVPVVTQFEAQVAILDLLEHKPILTGGYKAVLHVHSVVEECEITKLVAVIDPKTKEKKKTKFVKSGAICIARISCEKSVCVEAFDAVPQLGRFTLRDEGRTIAIGKILRVPKKSSSTIALAE